MHSLGVACAHGRDGHACRQGSGFEVPAAMTVADCRTLVSVSRETGHHCVMLENCCYDTWHLGVREIVRCGIIGRVKHLEGLCPYRA